MRSSKSRFRFISLLAVIFGLRWTSLHSPLPPTWTADSQVLFTARILDRPEQTDAETIIRNGLWTIKLKGYAEIIPGESYYFVGRVKAKLLLGKVTRIEMVDPTFGKDKEQSEEGLKAGESLILAINGWRQKLVESLQKSLSEPHASLAAGILLGVKANMPYDFYQALIKTGTLHVIAASGFNVAVVAAAVMFPLLRILRRGWAIMFGVIAVFIYVIMAGGSAAVVRAGIMGSLSLLAYGWGRPAEARRLLWVTAAAMLLISPLMLVDAGFQLSVAATAGLLYLEPWIRQGIEKWVKNNRLVKSYLADYLYPTLAATLATLPIIAYRFGRVSYLSPLVNLLVLPLIPLTMFLAALAAVTAGIPAVGIIAAWLLYIPLEIMRVIISWFGRG